MHFQSALSTAPSLDAAIRDVTEALRQALGRGGVDLCTVFVHPHYGDIDTVGARLRKALDARHLIGCTAAGVCGADREIEGRPALAVAAGRLPATTIDVRHTTSALPDGDGAPSEWTERFGGTVDEVRGIVVLADPFTMDVDALLAGLDFGYPTAPKIGGLASGGQSPGGHALFVDDAVHRGGAITATFSGNLRITPVVAQGCRPIGGVGAITACEGHHLRRIDEQTAAGWLQDQVVTLPPRDADLLRRAPVFLGLAMDPFALEEPSAGDFLVRNVLGLDRETGAMGVGGELAVGRKVQLHLRDRDSSDADLRRALAAARGPRPPGFALMFSCLGRGQGLYGEPDHDTQAFRELIGSTPLSGFFCNGEIGPVAGTTFVHGYTAALALFEEVSA